MGLRDLKDRLLQAEQLLMTGQRDRDIFRVGQAAIHITTVNVALFEYPEMDGAQILLDSATATLEVFTHQNPPTNVYPDRLDEGTMNGLLQAVQLALERMEQVPA